MLDDTAGGALQLVRVDLWRRRLLRLLRTPGLDQCVEGRRPHLQPIDRRLALYFVVNGCQASEPLDLGFNDLAAALVPRLLAGLVKAALPFGIIVIPGAIRSRLRPIGYPLDLRFGQMSHRLLPITTESRR